MKNILYIGALEEETDCVLRKQLVDHLEERYGMGKVALHCVDYSPIDCFRAIQTLRKYITEHGITCVIANELGGFLAMFMTGVQRIYINPIVNPQYEFPKLAEHSESFAMLYKPSYQQIYNTLQFIIDIEERALSYAVFTQSAFTKNVKQHYERLFGREHAYTVCGDGKFRDVVIAAIAVDKIDNLERLKRYEQAMNEYPKF